MPPPSSPSRDSIPSPLTTLLPSLTPQEAAALPYPPDFFPSARDVQTSFGSMRVYEWGPEDGRKVMLVHGDATPAPLFKLLADRLVAKGCRLIAFDLWGRGYTSTPLVPHTARLYALQLLFAASSSPLHWCTPNTSDDRLGGFSIVGFSLGGAITMDFFASFPHLVRSLALLAPVGLLRELPEDYEELRQTTKNGRGEEELRSQLRLVLGVETEAEDKAVDERLGFDPAAVVKWQFEKHEGHVASFTSTLQHGPLQYQHEVWKDVGTLLGSRSKSARERHGDRSRERLMVICGREDDVVPAEHLREDLDDMMDAEEFVFKTVPGTHGFLLYIESCEEIVALLAREWKL